MNAASSLRAVSSAAQAVATALDTPVPQWRLSLHDRLDELRALLGAVLEIDICVGDNGDANTVARLVLELLDENESLGAFEKADDYYGECFFRVEALLRSAVNLPDLSVVMKAQLCVVNGLAHQISKFLDEADLKQAASPPIPSLAAERASWMEGKALCTEMLQIGIDLSENGSDAAGLQAGYRGPAVPQNVFVKPFFDTIMRQPELQPGFLATLASHLAACGNAGDDPEAVRAFSWEECFGGPSVFYMTGDHPSTVLIRNVAERLTQLWANEVPGADVYELLHKAANAANEAVNTIVLAEAKERIQAARDAVAAVQLAAGRAEERPREQLLAELAEIDRQIGSFLTGEPADARPTFTDPFEVQADRLLVSLDMNLEGLEHVGISPEHHTDLHRLANPHFWRSRELLDQHATADLIVAEICALRDGLQVLEPLMDPSPGLPLVRQCIGLINAFLDEGDDGGDAPQPAGGAGPRSMPERGIEPETFPGRERVAVAGQAGAFINRVTGYFQVPGRQGTMGDLAAIHQCASVVMSALSDRTQDAMSLASRLDEAVTQASVIFEEQPPRYWRSPGPIRPVAVGKRLVASA